MFALANEAKILSRIPVEPFVGVLHISFCANQYGQGRLVANRLMTQERDLLKKATSLSHWNYINNLLSKQY